MSTIDQLRMNALTNISTGQSLQKTTASEDSSFKKIMKSVMEIPENLDAIFKEASQKYGVSEKLLKAVAKAESNFDSSATSKKGAMGVMQLMPATAKSLGVSDPYDARSNIMGGAKYLKENLDRYDGDVELTLAAYNAGSNNVKKYGGIPPFKETQDYVKKIMDYMGETDSDGYTQQYTSSSSVNTNPYYSQGGYSTSDLLNALQSITGELTNTDSSGVSSKSDCLYLIELLKMQMQKSSFEISDQSDSTDSISGLL